MLSNITSYIFGGQETEAETGQNQSPKGSPTHYPANTIPPLSDGEEEWVVVAGGNDHPSLTLGSLNEINPIPPTGCQIHTPPAIFSLFEALFLL